MNGDPESEDPAIQGGLIKKDLLMVKPYERLQIVEKLMQYTVPKMQSVAVEAEVSTRQQKTTERLISLSNCCKKGRSTDEIATICIVEKDKLLQKGSLNEVNCCKMGLHARAKRKEKKRK